MVVDESGLTAELKRRHKSGYDVAVEPGTVVIQTEDWMVETKFNLLPRKALGLLVEHMGLLPAAGEAIHVQRDCENQGIMPSIIRDEVDGWMRVGTSSEARPAPLAWGAYQLYQDAALRLVGVPPGALGLVDSSAYRSAIALDGDRLLWSADGQTIIVNVYHPFSGREADWWTHLERIDWKALEDEA